MPTANEAMDAKARVDANEERLAIAISFVVVGPGGGRSVSGNQVALSVAPSVRRYHRLDMR
jgi:hypothetical protein